MAVTRFILARQFTAAGDRRFLGEPDETIMPLTPILRQTMPQKARIFDRTSARDTGIRRLSFCH